MKTLYEESFEHDNCGIGAVVNINGSQTHKIVDNALSIVEKLEHRAMKRWTTDKTKSIPCYLNARRIQKR